ncbi:phosphoglucosamine mutase [Candidatus Bipolaricaulota bacterium]|nr:phosphoglucosamine mutase [Candidatus Bipolaricaulota bacterium]
MTDLFGTDGVRGRANEYVTAELALSLARAAASRLLPNGGRVIIGRDTRLSGPMLESALGAGFASAGVDVLLAGIIPTPAISFLIKDERADLGAVISASHNEPTDNGIKFFDRNGMKLRVEQEEGIEAAIKHLPSRSSHVGSILPLQAAARRYAAFLTGTIESDDIDLSGLKIIVDCAYGATGAIAPHVLRHFNARVVEMHTAPDGERINRNCGSTHLDTLREAVLSQHADLGIAFDGDGDRVLLISPSGEVIDGDRMMGIAALHMSRVRRLDPQVVVATVMSNMGLEHILTESGLRMLRTPVGDRHVAQTMLKHGAQLGGEQSGHIIFSDHSPTGDGILTAIKLLEISHERGKPLHVLADEIPLYPQARADIPADNPGELMTEESVIAAIKRGEERLAAQGRILVRPSGTQPVVRVLVESSDEALCKSVCQDISSAIEVAR